MKKIISILVCAVMVLSLCSAFAISGSALDAFDATTLGKPDDFTEMVKCATMYEVYEKRLPVIRADALFLHAEDFDYCKEPGHGDRTITFTDWEAKGFESFYPNDFDLGDGVFLTYNCKWANKTDCGDWDDRGRMSVKFTVDEAGLYEFVFMGCAQIKTDVLTTPSKERGFAYDVDGKGYAMVNISRTHGAFACDSYIYTYSGDQLKEGYEQYKELNMTTYYEPAYYYGITFDLTAGEHTLNFYTLPYTSDGEKVTGDGPRLNFMGAYVEKAISDSEFENYKYPETEVETTAAETPAPVTTESPKTTSEPEQTTSAPEDTTKGTEVTTAAPKTDDKKSGCGSAMGFAAVLALAPAALCVRRRKH